MDRRASGRAGGITFRPGRRSKAAVVAAVIAMGVLATGAGATPSARPSLTGTSVGRSLAPDVAARMEAVIAPARIAKVATVPSSRELEAWGFGHAYSTDPAWASSAALGQPLFMRYTRSSGWRVDGPVLGADGRPDSGTQIGGFALDATGEGWAVGGNGSILHREPGGAWRIDSEASALSRGLDLRGISIKSDARGTYGFAVGDGPTFLALEDGRWRVDNASGVGAGNQLLGSIVGVAAIDRERAYAVGEGSRELILYRRTEQGWARILVNKPLYDTAPSIHDGDGGAPVLNQFATGAAIAEAGGVVWVTGSIQPIDGQRYISQRGPGSDPSRPFALRIGPDGSFRDYCPAIYQVDGGGVTTTARLCDETFPLATGALHGVDVLDDGRVFAGGFGMFEFDGRRWARAPNVAGIVSSVAFHSSREGWVASYGNRTGQGFASSSSNVVGHWTATPAVRGMLRRWPHPARSVVEAVSLRPGAGGDEAMAVGGGGTIARLERGVGWDVLPSPTTATLHDVAWVTDDRAFAVGENGTILRYDGSRWSEDPASKKLVTTPLYALAFRSISDGVAVGNRGAILRFDGSRWTKDPASGRVNRRLGAVAFAGDDAIAVGEKGTILVRSGAGWSEDRAAHAFGFGQTQSPANVLAVVGLPDGRAFMGGQFGILFERDANGRIAPSKRPLLGSSIHTMAAIERAASVRLLVSTGSTGTRFDGPGIIEPHGWLFEGDERGWRAAGDQRISGTGPELDAPVRRDAVYDIAVDGATGKGFAAGGFPTDVQDDDGHLSVDPTGSIWRLSLDRRPEGAPGQDVAGVRARPNTISFAFLGDSACTDGLCSASTGTGMRADEMLARALSDIERAAGDGVVRFLTYGGDARRLGLPEELVPLRSLFESLRVPVYGAIGDKDLFGGVGEEGVLASNGYFLSSFRSMPAPWGHAPAPPGFVPVSMAGQPQASTSLARTHYAFDYAPSGRPLVRVIVLDTSRSPFVVAQQNPQSDQVAFLQGALSTRGDVPAIVVMHQPFVAPLSRAPESSTITTALVSGNASAVLSSHDRVNRMVASPPGTGVFDVFTAGSVGSPLGASWRPEMGAFHAWHVVDVPVGGRGPVEVRAMPVLESVVLSAPKGRVVPSGETLSFSGLARAPDTGGGHIQGRGGDPFQMRAHYISFPMPVRCGNLIAPREGCQPADVMRPDHRFFCEDDLLCAFVKEDPQQPGQPFRNANGALERDEHSGLMCAFGAGATNVVLRAGTMSSRLPVRIGGGSGVCNPRIIEDPDEPEVLTSPGAQRQQPVLQREDPPPQILKPRTFELAAIPALAPPPVQPAPAPPGGGAPKYEEEREAATEKSEMTALPVATRGPSPVAGGAIGLLVVTALLLAAPQVRPRAGGAHVASQLRYAYAGNHRSRRHAIARPVRRGTRHRSHSTAADSDRGN